MTRMRAIEHGRASLQISTVGVSAMIDPDGTVTQQTGHYTAENMVGDMKLRTTLTPATMFGNWIAFFFNLTAIIIVAAIFISMGVSKLISRAMREDRARARTARTIGSGSRRQDLGQAARQETDVVTDVDVL